MSVHAIRNICFAICILCILGSLLLGIAMIWDWVKDSDFIHKSFMTLGALFVASLLTLSVAKKLGVKDE
ncbi:hypothetical protein LG201_08665 [Methylobacillus gramineus]|uniref:hypothetical protein n=1 Tax=Methylobacillus gramineus TaxID=755169 RepID=UPI001CFFCA80|nr:hypothetical protein [Methylobacillus gramineus]MCB5185274.1 hypothetical protein [Methylobacillus gramineus]